MYSLIIAGSRDFGDYKVMCWEVDQALLRFKPSFGTPIEIVSGTAKGADELGEKYAREHRYKLRQFPANWDKHGKAAGFLRNKQMAEYADGCIVFRVNKSKGSSHMIDLAKEYRLDLHVIEISR